MGKFQFYNDVLMVHDSVNNLWSGLNPCAFTASTFTCCNSGGSTVQRNHIVGPLSKAKVEPQKPKADHLKELPTHISQCYRTGFLQGNGRPVKNRQ